jgi:hypothetical protein
MQPEQLEQLLREQQATAIVEQNRDAGLAKPLPRRTWYTISFHLHERRHSSDSVPEIL